MEEGEGAEEATTRVDMVASSTVVMVLLTAVMDLPKVVTGATDLLLDNTGAVTDPLHTVDPLVEGTEEVIREGTKEGTTRGIMMAVVQAMDEAMEGAGTSLTRSTPCCRGNATLDWWSAEWSYSKVFI